MPCRSHTAGLVSFGGIAFLFRVAHAPVQGRVIRERVHARGLREANTEADA